VLVGALTFALVLAAPTRADVAPSPFAGGAGFAPSKDDAAHGVAMAGEKVVLTVHAAPEGAFLVVDATFRMTSPKKVTLEAAFPGQGVPVGPGVFAVHPRLYGFAAFVDDKPVAARAQEKRFTSEAGPPGRGYKRTRTETWHTFPVVIDDATTLRVRYAVGADGQTTLNDPPLTYASAGYILHTGAAWAGAIGEVVVEVRAGAAVDLAAVGVRTADMPERSYVSLTSSSPPPPPSPPNTTRTTSVITTTWTNLEPTAQHDLEITWPATTIVGYGDPTALQPVLEAAARR
jgi:hypothetical protein